MLRSKLLHFFLTFVVGYIFQGQLLNFSGSFDGCAGDGPEDTFSIGLFWASVVCIALFFAIYLVFSPPSVTRGRRLRVALVAYIFLWWCATFCVGSSLKRGLGDTRCSRQPVHANSVSGHYVFFVFWPLTMLWALLDHLEAPLNTVSWRYLTSALQGASSPPSARSPANHPNSTVTSPDQSSSPTTVDSHRQGTVAGAPASRVLATVWLFGTALSVVILWHTWTEGFHSPRQICYGALVSLLSHYVLANVLDHGCTQLPSAHRGPSAQKTMLYLLAFITLLATTCALWARSRLTCFQPFELGGQLALLFVFVGATTF